MKTILELLIRLTELHNCYQRVRRNRQLTKNEKAAVSCMQNLLRDSLPPEVLPEYDLLIEFEPQLRKCPEIFAMAVLVSTYQELSPAKRKKLMAFFDTPVVPAPSQFSQRAGANAREPLVCLGHSRVLVE